jgi:drug/metabolite transporter (DMT)-like permease
MPLMVALLSTRFSPADKPGGLRLAGLVGAALVLVATLGYATAPIIVNRRLADLDPLGPIAVSLGLAIVALLPAAIVTPPVAAASAGRPPAP